MYYIWKKQQRAQELKLGGFFQDYIKLNSSTALLLFSMCLG